MGYIENTVMPGEQIVARARPHWVMFLPVAWAVFFGVVGAALAGPLFGFVFFVLFAVPLGLRAFVRYISTELAVTNKRVIGKTGFISRTSVEVLLTKVEGIAVDQNITGRMLNYGTIRVAGASTAVPFSSIAMPLEFRSAVQGQIEATTTKGQIAA